MGDVEEKLRRGFALIERSGGDSDLLGAALLAIHGALEDHFRDTLSTCPDLSQEDRELLADRNLGWVTLVTLMQKYGGLSREERRIILEANDVRRSFAHGEPFGGRVSSLLRYGRFVEALCDRAGLLDQVLIEQYRARTRAAPARVATEPPGRPGGAASGRGQLSQARSGIPLQHFLALAALAVALVIGAWLYNQPEVRGLLTALGMRPAPSATRSQATSPPPTLIVQRARIVRLGGGPGWLHAEPSFTSGTLPIPLSEGMQVTLLDREQRDADGHLWREVSVGGYDGWCPADNLALE